MLLFVDESGNDRRLAPYEVLAGVAVQESNLWNLIQAIRSSEYQHFGMTLKAAGIEFKGSDLLKRKTFRLASQEMPIPNPQRSSLTYSLLHKGIQSRGKLVGVSPTRPELTSYGQSVIDFIADILSLCGQYHAKVFACMTNKLAPRPERREFLRKDYSYLFERYFYYLEDVSNSEMGLVVFDEIDKARARILLDQMSAYFLRTSVGRTRSGRVIPEAFFVHSDLTTLIQLADIIAYCLNWGVRLQRMIEPKRDELVDLANQAFSLRYVGSRPNPSTGMVWPVYGVTYIDDLRPREEREPEHLQ